LRRVADLLLSPAFSLFSRNLSSFLPTRNSTFTSGVSRILGVGRYALRFFSSPSTRLALLSDPLLSLLLVASPSGLVRMARRGLPPHHPNQLHQLPIFQRCSSNSQPSSLRRKQHLSSRSKSDDGRSQQRRRVQLCSGISR